jgi:tRNA G10  N-methylase Trm11
MMPSKKSRLPSKFYESFLKSLNASTLQGKFDPGNLFDHWFREQGKAYFFLFKKNLHVTNIQFGELIALIRTHLSFQVTTEAPYLRFVSPKEFRWSLNRLQETFDLTVEKNREYVAEVYAQQFGQTAVLDTFYCSCALYLPPLLDVDLRRICGESGYVHSCGKNLLTKLIYDTRACDLDQALRHFVGNIKDGLTRFFAIYAREDWPTGSETLAKSLQDGLEQIKIPVAKYFMGSQRLDAVLDGLRQTYKPQIFFAEPGRLDESRAEFQAQENIEPRTTIFLITDQQISDDSRASPARFYICYDQHYINENQFHIFDEDKPAWIDHTTIPHTLAAAMINITRPWWRKPERAVRICDPFCGTGTFWFEAAKLSPDVHVSCSDLSPAALRLAKDNLEFFSADPEALGIIKNMLQDSLLLPRDVKHRERHSSLGRQFNKAQTLSSKWLPAFDRDDYATQQQIINELAKESFPIRLLFYLILKTTRRHNTKIDTQAWWEFYQKEATSHFHALEVLLRQTMRHKVREPGSSIVSVGGGEFSVSCFLELGELPNEPTVKSDRNVLELANFHDEPIDVIVTDPPYGFNTVEDQKELNDLYEAMIPVFLSVLGDDSQLVISIPEWSHTGRQLPAFTFREFLTHKVLLTAAECGMEVVWSPSAVPKGTRSLFRAPFYWESERALRRSILHFRFLRKRLNSEPNQHAESEA